MEPIMKIQEQEHRKLFQHPTISTLLHDFDQFENFFLAPYSTNSANLNEGIVLDCTDEVLHAEIPIIEGNVAGADHHEQCTAPTIIEKEKDLGEDWSKCEEMLLELHSIVPLHNKDLIDLDLIDEILKAAMETIAEEGKNHAADGENVAIQTMDVKDNAESHGCPSNGNAKILETQVDENVKGWTTRKRYKKGSVEAMQRNEENKIKNREAAARSLARKQAYLHNLEYEFPRLQKKNAFLKKLLKFLKQNPGSEVNGKKLRRIASGPI